MIGWGSVGGVVRVGRGLKYEKYIRALPKIVMPQTLNLGNYLIVEVWLKYSINAW